jgi:hypothetical protein
MYPWVLRSDRLHEHGWSAAHSNREVVREFAAEHRAFVSAGRLRMRRSTLHRVAAAAGAGGSYLMVRGIRSRLHRSSRA